MTLSHSSTSVVVPRLNLARKHSASGEQLELNEIAARQDMNQITMHGRRTTGVAIWMQSAIDQFLM